MPSSLPSPKGSQCPGETHCLGLRPLPSRFGSCAVTPLGRFQDVARSYSSLCFLPLAAPPLEPNCKAFLCSSVQLTPFRVQLSIHRALPVPESLVKVVFWKRKPSLVQPRAYGFGKPWIWLQFGYLSCVLCRQKRKLLRIISTHQSRDMNHSRFLTNDGDREMNLLFLILPWSLKWGELDFAFSRFLRFN